jgi:predicted DNA-binding transcriptional regulator YafY
MQINRLIEIVYILLRQRSVTARELARRFDVSTRTIYRDVDNLSLAGIPVYTEKGKKGGISLLPDFVLSKSILSEEEQTEILSALQGLSGVQAAETVNVLHKLSAIFNKNAVSWLEVDFTDWGYSNGRIFSGLKTAILNRYIVEFDYYGTVGAKTRRRVEPMQLWFKSKAWYVKGYCLIRQDMRLFKLTRLRELTVTNEKFTERDLLAPRPEPEEPSAEPKPDVNIVARISAEMGYRVLDEFGEWAEVQPDGSYMVKLNWSEDEWFYGYLLSFGNHLEVLEPDRVKQKLKEKALKVAELY